MHDELKLTLRALDRDGLPVDGRRDAGGHHGFLANTRHALNPSSEHREENFPADVRFARIMVSHDALRRRQHRNAETVIHAREGLHRGVNAAARLGHPSDVANDRRAVEVLQLDLELARPEA